MDEYEKVLQKGLIDFLSNRNNVDVYQGFTKVYTVDFIVRMD